MKFMPIIALLMQPTMSMKLRNHETNTAAQLSSPVSEMQTILAQAGAPAEQDDLAQDVPAQAIRFIYGSMSDTGVNVDDDLKPADSDWKTKGSLQEFDQTPLIQSALQEYSGSADVDHQLLDTGYLYVPEYCAGGKNSCKFMIVSHGKDGLAADMAETFGPHATGYNIVMMFPQVTSVWDDSGYTGDLYDTKDSIQAIFFRHVIDQVANDLNINRDHVTAVGTKSGAYNSHFLHLVMSNSIKGSGLLQGSLYSTTYTDRILEDGKTQAELDAEISEMVAAAKAELEQRETDGLVDPLSNMNGAPVFVYSVENDPKVGAPNQQAQRDLMEAFGAVTEYVLDA